MIVIESFQWLVKHELVYIYGYVVMPNHIHVLWEQLKLNGKETSAFRLLVKQYCLTENIKSKLKAIRSLAQQTTDANEKPDSVWNLKNKG